MEVLDANRLGDVDRLKQGFWRKGTNVNLRTKDKAYAFAARAFLR